MNIDIAKSGFENVLALVNTANTLTLTATDVSIGTPSTITGTGGRNTKVTLTALEAANYQGTVDVNYRRLKVIEATTGTDYSTTFNSGTTLALALTAIATKLNLREADVEWVETQMPATGANGTLTLRPKSGSLLYAGATQAITLVWTEPALSSVVTTTDLPGFDVAA